MIRELDEQRVIKGMDKLFKENEELKARISILERLINEMILKEMNNETNRRMVFTK